jgi:hypothetical protein
VRKVILQGGGCIPFSAFVGKNGIEQEVELKMREIDEGVYFCEQNKTWSHCACIAASNWL